MSQTNMGSWGMLPIVDLVSPTDSPRFSPSKLSGPQPQRPSTLSLNSPKPSTSSQIEDEISQNHYCDAISHSVGPIVGSAKAKYDYYDINRILGVQKIRFNGEVREFAEVEWCKSLIDFKTIKDLSQRRVSPGLSREAKRIIREIDPKVDFFIDPSNVCKYCSQSYTSVYYLSKHERNCRVPGAPGHSCSPHCRSTCLSKRSSLPNSSNGREKVRRSVRRRSDYKSYRK